MKNKFDENEVITKDNVKRMGEYIAIAGAKRFCSRFYSDKAKRLYDGLVYDVYHHTDDPAQSFTDGYDLAMEAICFLCQHYGKRLSDTTKVLKYGVLKPFTIKDGCFFIVSQYINNRVTYIRKIQTIDDPVFLETFDGYYTIDDETHYSEEEWQKVDCMIENMNLTESEANVLECRMNGLSYPETARHLDYSSSAVYRRIVSLRKKCSFI